MFIGLNKLYLIGVSKYGNKYYAYACIKNKRKCLGKGSENIQDAIDLYQKYVYEYKNRCRTNKKETKVSPLPR